jgi:trk system potassium uptake protein TrkA
MQRCVVIGLGLFGTAVALEMKKNGAEVLAIDSDIKKVDAIKNKVTYAICLDSTDEEALRDQGIDQMDIAVVAIGVHFEASLITTSILHQFNIPKIFARATDPRKEALLKKITQNSVEVINPEESAGKRLGLTLISRQAREVTQLSDNFVVVEQTPPKEFIGKTLRDNRIREHFHVNVVAIKKPTGNYDHQGREIYEILNSPSPSDIVEDRDRLLIACMKDEADQLPWN